MFICSELAMSTTTSTNTMAVATMLVAATAMSATTTPAATISATVESACAPADTKHHGEESPILVIGFGNLANAAGDEKVDQYRFGTRETEIHDAVRKLKPDVFAASELRICADKDKTTQLQPSQIATRLASGSEMELADCRPQNLDAMSFWRATIFRPGTIKHRVSGSQWAIPPIFGSNKVEERGVMLLFSQFEVIATKTLFWVINSHMPIATAEKLKTIDWLNANAERVCQTWGDAKPIIIYGGDQNTFFPGPTLAQVDGKEMMDKFATGGWIHASHAIETTFRAFPHDPFRKMKPDGTSLLDHIFINASAKERIRIHGVAAHDTGASDHFFLTISLSIL
jgi:endonuclease/exonuclease/phosphatase family metal-dependent hydrolase